MTVAALPVPGRWAPRRAALRLARREALRHKGRSLLIVVMVALPVLGLTSADVIARTMQLDPAEHLARSLGRADAGMTFLDAPVRGQPLDPIASGYAGAGAVARPGSPAWRAAAARAVRLLPAGTRLVTVTTGLGPVSAAGRRLDVSMDGLDLGDPITTGIARLVSGTAPVAGRSQVAVSPALASRLGLSSGSVLTVAGHRRTVTGEAQDPADLRGLQVYAPPGEIPAEQGLALADTHRTAVTWPMVERLNRAGALVTSRAAVLSPPARGPEPTPADPRTRAEEIGIAIIAIGLAVLEAVLLAGAAFAVGARRQARDLALLAATGADAGQVRDVVLGSGVVLGVAGSVLGIGLGIAASAAALPGVQHLADADSGAFDLRPVELAVVGVVGLLTGIVAAVLPARAAARMDVVAALTGRRGTVSASRTVPAVGLSMAVLGAMLAAYSARPPAKFWLVLIGAVVGELGFVLCAPAVVAAAARLARRSPLPVRLALRDAARHRSRTGPAVAAIMAAVAGATAVAIYAQSSSAGAIAGYVAQARVGQTLLQLYGSPKDYAAHRSAVQAVLGRQLGAAGVVGLPTLDAASCGHHCRGPVSLDVAHSGCPGCRLAGPARVAVGDGRLLAAVLGRSDPAASRALSQGRAVVFLADGSGSPALRLAVPPRGHRRGSTESVPATAVDVGDSGAAVTAVVPPQTATRLGLRWGTDQWLVRTASVPTLGQQDAVQSTLHRTHAGVQLFVERGYTDNSTGYKLLALAVAAAIVTLGATGVVTGLSAAESRPDLATFAAVGAAPRTRRTLAASQAGTVALLGALTGVVSGTVSAFAILRSVGSIPFTMPWAVIAGMIVGVPLVAALAVGTLVRSRLPVERRVT